MKKGVLFRLDRPHPLMNFEFVDYNYFPCNTETILETSEEKVEKAFAEASAEAGFNFWGWFKTTLKGGAGYEDRDSSIKIMRTKVNSAASSVFQQWGVMHDHGGNAVRDVPFFVEKKFECQQGAGTADPGTRILSVVVQFWNDDQDRNDTYEFNNVSEWATIDDELYSFMQRPIFLSVNNSEEQAAVIQQILSRHEELHFNQAVFIFSQLNNGCAQKDRQKCDALVSIVQE